MDHINRLPNIIKWLCLVLAFSATLPPRVLCVCKHFCQGGGSTAACCLSLDHATRSKPCCSAKPDSRSENQSAAEFKTDRVSDTSCCGLDESCKSCPFKQCCRPSPLPFHPVQVESFTQQQVVDLLATLRFCLSLEAGPHPGLRFCSSELATLLCFPIQRRLAWLGVWTI